jgi:hypothetical protein
MSHVYDLSLVLNNGGQIVQKDNLKKILFKDGVFKTGYVELIVVEYCLDSFVICNAIMQGCCEADRAKLASWRV